VVYFPEKGQNRIARLESALTGLNRGEKGIKDRWVDNASKKTG
jgi:hypothetical protein